MFLYKELRLCLHHLIYIPGISTMLYYSQWLIEFQLGELLIFFSVSLNIHAKTTRYIIQVITMLSRFMSNEIFFYLRLSQNIFLSLSLPFSLCLYKLRFFKGFTEKWLSFIKCKLVLMQKSFGIYSQFIHSMHFHKLF